MGPGESVVVDVLGPFRVRIGDQPVELPPGRLRVLLAVLALSAGRAVSVDRLVDRIWDPGELPANARRTVQTYITRLRQSIGADAIGNEPAGYVLRTTPDCVDALRFERLVARAADEPDAERPLLVEALDLWRGDAFEDLDAPPLRAHEGHQLAELRLTATERRIDLDLAEGRATSMVAELRELAQSHPLREPLWARLLTALDATGRQAEALEQYEVVRRRIADELGVDPGPQLQRVHASLLAGDSLATVVTAESASRQPTVPRQLPADVRGFAGRERDLAALDQLLGDDDRTAPLIVAIHGTGGAGKTTLAVHWAHQVADRFPDGQLYLNLRGYGPSAPLSADAALHSLLSGLGLAGDQIPADCEARASLLRTTLADRRLLILLDNARDSEQIRTLLPGAGPSVVLVTSRSQLRGLVVREGAQRVGLEQLTPDEARELLSQVFTSHQIRPAPSDLDQLAASCGYLPLALTIAAERASRQPEFGLAEVIEELREERERLDALELDDDVTSQVRAVFAWSYQALDVDGARLFRLLGTHPGPDLSVAAAAAMAGESMTVIRRTLDRLVDVNLLQRRRAGRYELHDLLGAYAAELAAEAPGDDQDTAFDRLLEWTVRSAENARRRIHGNPPTIDPHIIGDATTPLEFSSAEQAAGWFAQERRFLVAAVHEAAKRRRHRATYLLVFATNSYFMRMRDLDVARDLLTLAKAAADAAHDTAAAAHASNFLGTVHAEMDDLGRSVDYFERAVAGFEQADHRRGLARAYENLSLAQRWVGRIPEAVRSQERAMELKADYDDDPLGMATSLNNLAMLYLDIGRTEEALPLAQEAIEVAGQAQIRHGVGNYQDTLGRVHAANQNWPAALPAFERALDAFQALDADWDVAATLLEYGKVLRALERPPEARDAWRRAYEILDEIGAADAPDISRAELTELLASVEPSD